VRAEQVATLAAEIAKAKSKLTYAETQLSRVSTLARTDTATRQALDQATEDVAAARADVAEAEANHAAAMAGPTKEERAIADAQVKAAASALAVVKRRLDKTALRSPVDGIVSVIVAEAGENVRAGQPLLAIQETGKPWLSFNVREDFLHGLTVGTVIEVARARARHGRYPPWSQRCGRSAPSRPGRPSVLSAIITPTHSGSGSTRKAARPDSSPA
jgi:HlyD family secretion protein